MIRITNQVLDGLSAEAAAAPRKRKNLNLHQRPDDPVQRLFNALEPGTYVRPHRHGEPSTWEVMYFIRGSAVFLVFDAAGTVLERMVLSSRGPVFGIEMPPDTWHAVAALEPGTVFFEVKQGPYIPPQGPHSASWAPGEGTDGAVRFEAWYRSAKVGDQPPALS
jgi:cupin fold WbuC family metalloprotein